MHIEQKIQKQFGHPTTGIKQYVIGQSRPGQHTAFRTSLAYTSDPPNNHVLRVQHAGNSFARVLNKKCYAFHAEPRCSLSSFFNLLAVRSIATTSSAESEAACTGNSGHGLSSDWSTRDAGIDRT